MSAEVYEKYVSSNLYFEIDFSHAVMLQCWKEGPLERPTFTELVKMLGDMLQDESDYLDLSTYGKHIYESAEPTSFDEEKV